MNRRLAMTGTLNWKTMPEALLEAGVSWKVYSDPTGELGLSVLPYFKKYTDVLSLTGIELVAKGLTPTYPGDFASDVAGGNLPSVSWIIPPLYECEHPAAAPPEWGEYLVQQILNTLVSNPDVWAQTVFLVVYLTGALPSSADSIAGPIGLGFRTPCLVVFAVQRRRPTTTLTGNTTVIEEAVLNALTGTLDVGIDYPGDDPQSPQRSIGPWPGTTRCSDS